MSYLLMAAVRTYIIGKDVRCGWISSPVHQESGPGSVVRRLRIDP